MRKILVVDDDPAMRDLLKTALARWGHQVITAQGGAAAWDLLMQEGHSISMVVTDIEMADGDGIALITQIVAAGRRWPILALSGSPAYCARAAAAGADAVLSKMGDLAQLQATLQSMAGPASCP